MGYDLTGNKRIHNVHPYAAQVKCIHFDMKTTYSG